MSFEDTDFETVARRHLSRTRTPTFAIMFRHFSDDDITKVEYHEMFAVLPTTIQPTPGWLPRCDLCYTLMPHLQVFVDCILAKRAIIGKSLGVVIAHSHQNHYTEAEVDRVLTFKLAQMLYKQSKGWIVLDDSLIVAGKYCTSLSHIVWVQVDPFKQVMNPNIARS